MARVSATHRFDNRYLKILTLGEHVERLANLGELDRVDGQVVGVARGVRGQRLLLEPTRSL